MANNSSNSREVGEQSRTVNNSSRTEPLDSSIRVLPSSSSRTQEEGMASSRTVESSSSKTLLATRRPTPASRKEIKVQLVTKATSSSSKNRGQRRQRSRETEVRYLTCDLIFSFDISF